MIKMRGRRGRAHVDGATVTLLDGVATCCDCSSFLQSHFFEHTDCVHMLLINRPLRISMTDDQVVELVVRWMWWIGFVWFYDLPISALIDLARPLVESAPDRFPNRMQLYAILQKKLYRLGGERVV